ncbi:MAG: ABC transporter permease [Butyrivibrio sp.]|nr:ABC transporter permease [Butyrivibrio sp.]
MIFKKICGYIKFYFSNKKRNKILIIALILFLTELILNIVSGVLISTIVDQQAAERWDQDSRVAQVSLFFTESRMITPDDINKLEYMLEKKMSEVGIIQEEEEEETQPSGKKIVDTVDIQKPSDVVTEPDDTPEEVKVYASCYSAQGISTIKFESKTAENIDTIGVSGDFFLFHPMELVNGSYFSPDELMKDRIVVDEELAWQLFGSDDIVGKCVTIGGINHYIAGVVKRDGGRLNEAAGLSKSFVYMSYESLARYGTIFSGRTESKEISEDGATINNGGINCYEIVMPDPVEGLAKRLVKESSGVEDMYVEAVDNTNRYSFFALAEVISKFGIRSMWGKPIYYPYWENVAKAWEDILAFILLIRIICIVVVAVIATVLIVSAYRHKTWTVAGIVRFIADKKYDYEARKKLSGK